MKRNSKQYSKDQVHFPARGITVACMVFLSGSAGLVYQVLWMRQLGLLFGNTAQAASATLAAFFLGLGVGSWYVGRRVSTASSPLKAYAWLEWGIAISAIIYFGLLRGFEALYPSVYGWLGTSPWMLVAKLLLSLLLVFPAAFFMGGTVPVIGQFMIHDRKRFGSTAAWLYGLNTLGAALGVWAAAFWLIPTLGFKLSYSLTVLLSVAIGVTAWKLAKNAPSPEPKKSPKSKQAAADEKPGIWGRCTLVGLCFFSGFVVLALEVVWTRIFAQVHENSVYAFAIILIVVLIGLAIGAGFTSLVTRFVQRPMLALALMTTFGGFLLVFGPSLIMQSTDGLQSIHTIESWGDHVRESFRKAVGGIGLTVIALGMVFPFLMKLAEDGLKLPGQMLGRLLAINTAGAIAGAMLCGFLFLPALGMWGTMKVLTAAYLLIAILLPSGWSKDAIACRLAAISAMALLFTVFDPSGLPTMAFTKENEPDKVLEVYEESDSTVAVVENKNGHRAILVNAGYTLGSTGAYTDQANQARIPLYLFPETESICFIGMGTGISAGASLDFRFPKVKRVVTCELSPSVVEASRKWIPEHLLGGLFDDPRSTVLIEDGRNYLMASGERFDMINSDLFLPYRRGAGSLYSMDHYQVVADCLNPGGVFVQWLPLFQLTEYEFGVIARTMNEVFGEVTMWRNNFDPGVEKVALIGRLQSSPLASPPNHGQPSTRQTLDGFDVLKMKPEHVLVDAESIPFFYAGNLSKAAHLFQDYPINTDDKPVIEYETPKKFREVAQEDNVIWCVGPKLSNLIDRIFEASPIKDDPIWQDYPESGNHMIRAGIAFYKAIVARTMGKYDQAEIYWDIYMREWES